MTPSPEILLDQARLYESLSSDVNRCVNFFREKSDAQLQASSDEEKLFWFRTLIRTAFARIEGTLYMMKQTAWLVSKETSHQFTDDELSFIIGKAYKNSVPTKAFKSVSLQQNILRTFKLFTLILKINFELDTESRGWNDFQQTIRIRNGLMHPKLLSDIYPKDEDIRRVVNASQWFEIAYEQLMEQAMARLLSLQSRVSA